MVCLRISSSGWHGKGSEILELNLFKKIFFATSEIPYGKVSTYGEISQLVGANNPRIVGYALSSLESNTTVPWHRVVNRFGMISRREEDSEINQRVLLESEGVEFSPSNQIDLRKYFCRIENLK